MKCPAVCLLVLSICLGIGTPPAAFSCTTIIVGKNRTADHSVLIAHNEDDEGTLVLRFFSVAARKGGEYRLFNGGSVPEPKKTLPYMGPFVYDKAIIPGDYFGGVNSHQVAAYNNQAPGKSGNLDISGGIMWTEFNELAMMQARTAREAVQIIGRLNETRGLTADPGTAFGIADPNEGWWIELAPGGQWAARRVPDDAAEMMANCYRIGEIDFSDSTHKNFMWSKDVVAYAQSRGWYEAAGGKFHFARAYSLATALTNPDNTARHKMVQRYLDALQKVSAADLMTILRSHYEGSELGAGPGGSEKSPHHTGIRTVCTARTQASFVTQLRNWLPEPVGGVVWLALRSPDSSVFVPWYAGVTVFPEPYATGSDSARDGSAWRAFDGLARHVDSHYHETIHEVRDSFEPLERLALSDQQNNDRVAAILWRQDPALAIWWITKASGEYGVRAYAVARDLLSRLEPR
jgi:dipeptidase